MPDFRNVTSALSVFKLHTNVQSSRNQLTPCNMPQFNIPHLMFGEILLSWVSFVPQSNVLSFAPNVGEDFLKTKSLPREYADLTVPNYGVEVPQGVDFSKYNQNRVFMNKQVSNICITSLCKAILYP